MASGYPLTLRWVALAYFVDSILRFSYLDSSALAFGFFIHGRTAYTLNLVLLLLGLYVALGLARHRAVAYPIACVLSIFSVASALLLLVVPQSRDFLTQIGRQMEMQNSPDWLQMAIPYLGRGMLHACCLAWLLMHPALSHEAAPFRSDRARQARG